MYVILFEMQRYKKSQYKIEFMYTKYEKKIRQ